MVDKVRPLASAGWSEGNDGKDAHETIELKCPKCKKHAMKTVSKQRLKIALGHGRVKRIIRTTYVCQNCGHQITHDTDDNDDDKLNAALAAASIARMAMRGSSGGSTGGSFGGGSTGGGGSTSGW